jgi:hypothetical protein
MDNSFLVAKYIPDLGRMEPKNMGIILWANGHVRTRFADSESLGVNADEANFTRWVDYWERLTDGDRLQIENRRPIRKSNPRYLRELSRAQRGNYILESGGEIVEPFENVDEAADFLFATIVATSGQPREVLRDNRTKQLSDGVLQAAGLSEHPDFAQNYAVPLQFGEVRKPVHFHYALAPNGHPKMLLLRVNISRELSVTSTAGKFATVESLQICPKERCFSLFDGGEDQADEHADTINFLNYWSVPLDVSSNEAPNRLRQLVA